MSQPLADADRSRALDQIDQLLAARPDLRPTLETLYAEAWPETLTLLAALPAPQDWPFALESAVLPARPQAAESNANRGVPRGTQSPLAAGGTR